MTGLLPTLPPGEKDTYKIVSVIRQLAEAANAPSGGGPPGDGDYGDISISGGVWRIDHKLYVNVQDYGAAGDGTTNDTTSIQSAIAAAEAMIDTIAGSAEQGGGCVFFPAGTYRITSQIVTTKSISFLGVGRLSSVILVDNTSGGILINADASTNQVLIERLSIQAMRADAGIAIEYNGGSSVSNVVPNLQVKNVEIAIPAGTSGWGFSTGIYVDNCWNSTFDDVHLLGNTAGWLGAGIELGPSCINNFISNCNITAFIVGVDVSGTNTEGLFINNCTIIAVEIGVRSDHSTGGDQFQTIIRGCHIATNVSAVAVVNMAVLIVSDCFIWLQTTGSHTVASGAVCLRLTDTYDAVITGNVIIGESDTLTVAIYASTPSLTFGSEHRPMIAGNVIRGFDKGIWLEAGVTNARIGSNVFDTIAAMEVQYDLLDSGDASGNVVILDDGDGSMVGVPAIDMANVVDEQKFKLFHGGNNRFGFGIVSGAMRIFAPTSTVISFGELSSADGTTFTEGAQYIPDQSAWQYNETSAPASPSANKLKVYAKDVSGDTHLFTKDSAGLETDLNVGGIGTGDVVGPAGATDLAVARYDLATGKLIQNSTAILEDSGHLTVNPTGAEGLTVGTDFVGLSTGTRLVNIFYNPVGSGIPGPADADHGLHIVNFKQNWNDNTTAVAGELDGILVAMRNGGPAAGSSDTSAFGANIGVLDGSGTAVACETVSYSMNAAGTAKYGVDIQWGIVLTNGAPQTVGYFVEPRSGTSAGTLDIAYQVTQPTGTTVENLFLYNTDVGVRFAITADPLIMMFPVDGTNTDYILIENVHGTKGKFTLLNSDNAVFLEADGATGNLTVASIDLTTPLAVADGGTGQTTEAEAIGELIQALTADTAPDNAADYIGTYDASADTGKKVALSTIVREKLTANRTYYVRSGGSDSNGGLSSGDAFATLQKAYNVIITLDLFGFVVTIDVGSGTFTGALLAVAPLVGGTITISGAGAASTTLTATGAHVIDIECPAVVTVQSVTLTSSGGAACLNALNGGLIYLGTGVEFGTSTSSTHMQAGPNGIINNGVNYTISGACYYHMSAAQGTIQNLAAMTVTITGTPAWGGEFAHGSVDGVLSQSSVTYQNASAKTRQATTADTHSNTTLDNIGVNTSNLSTGMAIIGTNIPAGTTISSISSATAVVMSAAATGTAAGQAVAFEIATGIRYHVNSNAVITSNGGGTTYFPGSAAHSTPTLTGGQYV